MNDIQVRTALNRLTTRVAEPMGTALITLLLAATWGLLHRYKGLALDGELYAFQSLARLDPWLRNDLYLSGNSQDQYTLFSPLYAVVIRWVGLWNAAFALFTLCTVTFFVGAWSVARSLWDALDARLAVATSIVIVCGYGAYGVFTYAESFLTARSMAEAMVVVALACRLGGFPRSSWVVAAGAMLIHPLMALPGLLLLACLSVPIFYAVLGAIAGVLAVLLVSLLALHSSGGPRFLAILGGDWLEMVRERSQYLFLQRWRLEDWENHAVPLLTLIVAALVADGRHVRQLCQSAALVGVAGLVVALIACSVGPIAIFLQGQAWRWFWVTGFVSVLTLAPTALRLWRADGCGAVCASLLLASWMFPPVDTATLATAALGIWLARRHAQPRTQQLMQWLAYAIVTVILAWVIGNIWSICTNPPVGSTSGSLLLERLRSIYALQIPALVIVWISVQWLRSGGNVLISVTVCTLLCPLCWLIYRDIILNTLVNNSSAGTASEISSLSRWREAIPLSSTVLIVPSMKSAGTIWFTLQRPSYLTVNQSAGVVFSPETAAEVRRRSAVLLPVMAPDWKIKSQLDRVAKAREAHADDEEKPSALSAEQLASICRDRQLGFVIAKEQLGFDAIQLTVPGRWKDWNLYDCSWVRQGLGP